jgi:hypothetical protein
MPLDSLGNFRHNHESAKMHSESAGKKYMAEKPADGEQTGGHVEIHPKGDGTFMTKHNGEEMDHPTHGHALIHAAKVHAEAGHKHFHAHHDGASLNTHSDSDSREDGDIAGAHDHLSEAMGEEQGDEGSAADDKSMGEGLGGMY